MIQIRTLAAILVITFVARLAKVDPIITVAIMLAVVTAAHLIRRKQSAPKPAQTKTYFPARAAYRPVTRRDN